MKGTIILYWTFVGLLTAFMMMGAVPDLLRTPDAISWMAHLGYPSYLLSFLGFAKVLGLITILFPRFLRLKEWAYSGLAIDLLGALYSHLYVGDSVSFWIFPVIGIVLLTGSYILFRRKQRGHAGGKHSKGSLRSGFPALAFRQKLAIKDISGNQALKW